MHLRRFTNSAHSAGAAGALRFIGLMLVALNLRSPIVAVAPIISEIRADDHLSATVAGLLTSIPVLFFGAFAPVAVWIIGKTGVDRAVTIAMTGAALGIAIRPFGGVPALYLGTAVLGAALTIGNIVALMVIHRDFRRRAATVTGSYTAALNVGTILTSALTAPIALVVGWHWGLACWVVLALLAGFVWHISIPEQTAQATPTSNITIPDPGTAAQPATSIWRRPIVWILTGAMTVHLFIYYAITAWLPHFFTDTLSMSLTNAGLSATLLQALSLATAFVAPFFIRLLGAGWTLATLAGCWAMMPLGLLVAPTWWPIWSLFGALAQGGLFSAIFMLIVDRSRSQHENAQMSTVVQGVGYAVASLGPLYLGAVIASSGGWVLGFGSLTALACTVIIMGVAFALGERRTARGDTNWP